MANGKTKKTQAPKKERKQRTKMRSRKESVAGHFADRLAANIKQHGDIMRAVAGFPGISQSATTAEVVSVLNSLANAGFKPERRKGGNRGPSYAPGQPIKLAPEAIALLKPQFPQIDAIATFVADNYDGGKSVPVRAGGSGLTDTWVGFVSKKLVAAV